MTDEIRKRIIQACFKMLLPLARVLLVNGISYREFDEACRRAFVTTASTEFGVRGRETNTSRISAMTGLPRKEVQRLRKNLHTYEPRQTSRLSPLADLLHLWATSKEYQNEDGSPRILSFSAGSQASFESIVRRCLGDVPPGAVKAELLRLGVVSVVNTQELKLVKRSLIPPNVDERLESSILYSLHGLAQTVAHNNDPRNSDSNLFFERFVESHPIPAFELSKMRSLIRDRLMKISEDLDSELNSIPAGNEENGSRRIGVGLFYSE